MSFSTKVKLALMMVLQFFVWGSWYGQLGKYMTDGLQATGDQVGAAFAAFSIAMIVSPFFVGMLADRFFSAQRLLALLNFLGAVILYFLAGQTEPLAFIPAGQEKAVEIASSWNKFYWIMLLYCLTFAPNIALTSSIALRQMKDPGKEFPPIRVFGTIGWIAVVNLIGFFPHLIPYKTPEVDGYIMVFFGVGSTAMIFKFASIAALILSVFALTLPDTPPRSTDKVSFGQIIGKDAFVLFRDRSFTIFFIASILICIPLSFYYTWANSSLTDSYKAAYPAMESANFNIENKMSLGQASEVLFMLLLPFAYRKLGVKKILIIGLIAWIIRFLFFGYGSPDTSAWMLYTAILLHGVCFDFFFVTGYIYADYKAGEKIKSQAQGLITLATYGVGMLIGSIIAGKVKEIYTTGAPPITNWLDVWLVPTWIAVVVLGLFILTFKDNTREGVH